MECDLERTTIHYQQYGDGKPIILLHGGSVDHRHMVKDFEPIFTLRKGWKRIYPDMPGMGKSPGQDWIVNLDLMLEVILEFIDAVIPRQNFCVGGTSFGGFMAQGVIYQRPKLIDGVILMTPAIAGQGNENLPTHTPLVQDPGLLSEMNPEEEEFFRNFAVVQSRELLESIRRDVFPAFEIADHEFLDRFLEPYSFTFDVGHLPEPFDKPSLFLLGRQDSDVGYRDAWELIENYPRASFVVLDRSGHGLGVEQQHLFRTMTNEWLDRVEEYLRINT